MMNEEGKCIFSGYSHKKSEAEVANANSMGNGISLHLLLLLVIVSTILLLSDGGGARRRVHISDDLENVVDEEEDEAWRQWGKKSASPAPDFNPPDFSGKDVKEIQAEMMRRQVGPVFGFVKLRLGVRRTPDMVSEIAMKWTKLSRTGAIETQFMGVDLSTIMFTMEKGQDSLQLKEFVLDQPESYEIKIGDQVFRRPGDPPVEELLEKLHKEKAEAENSSVNVDEEQGRDEL